MVLMLMTVIVVAITVVAVMAKSWVNLVMVIRVLGMDDRHTHAALLALHGCVEMVFDCVVRSPGHMLGHLCPFGSELVVELKDSHVFLMSEGCLVDYVRIYVVWKEIFHHVSE